MVKFKSKLKKGITLIEAAMVLAIGAIVIAGVMLFYQGASTNSKTNTAIGQIVNVQAVVNQLYSATSGVYTGINNAAVYSSMPAAMQGATTSDLVNAFGGTVTLASPTANRYSVAFATVPGDACVKLASVDLGSNLVSVQIGTAAAITAPTPANLATACAAGTNNGTITWLFS